MCDESGSIILFVGCVEVYNLMIGRGFFGVECVAAETEETQCYFTFESVLTYCVDNKYQCINVECDYNDVITLIISSCCLLWLACAYLLSHKAYGLSTTPTDCKSKRSIMTNITCTSLYVVDGRYFVYGHLI
jgi:hypothetical protein